MAQKLKNKKVTSAKFCAFKDINFRRFDGLLAILRKKIRSNIFPEVLFRAASVLQSIILSFNELDIG